MDNFVVNKSELNSALIHFTCDLLEDDKLLEGIEVKDYKKSRLELLILYMFLVTLSLKKKGFPKELLDAYHLSFWNNLDTKNILPETLIIKDKNITLSLNSSSIRQEYINERYFEYYKLFDNIAEKNILIIGKAIANNLGCKNDDIESIMKVGSSIVITLKCINEYLEKFELK